jgi:hypothetical protein
MTTGSNFSLTLASIKLLASGYLTRNTFRKGLFWSEMFIHASLKGSLKDLGYGFMMRGSALSMAYLNTHKELEIIAERGQVGQVVKQKMTSDETFTEALSSLWLARQLFERVGCDEMEIKCVFLVADIFFLKPFKRGARVELKRPCLVTKVRGLDSSVPGFTGTVLTSETLGLVFNRVEQMVKKFMNPIDIIYFETHAAYLHLLGGRVSESRTYFTFAYTNFLRNFCVGSEFIPETLSLKKLQTFHRIVQHLCILVVRYSADFAKEHLILFDILNSIRILLMNRLREPTPLSEDPVFPSIDLTDQIF